MKGMELKYVILNHCFPVIFSEAIQHKEMLKVQVGGFPARPTSAGYIRVVNGKVECYGASLSLELVPKKDDARVIQNFMRAIFPYGVES